MDGMMLAFSGKGGSGKTTLASLVLRELVRTGRGPVLAVDADPNATFAISLGVDLQGTVADIREDMGQAAKDSRQIPKDRLMEQWLAELLSEHTGFDLLTMGRPEGPKCYCYTNSLLRRYLKLLRGNYPYVVVDCQAGMEYISRLTVDDVDAMVLVAEATPVGLTTVRRIAGLVDSLPIKVGRRVLAVNKVDPSAGTAGLDIELPGVGQVVRVPFDPDLARRCAQGEPIDEAAGPNARSAVEKLTAFCLGLAAGSGANS